MTTQTKYAGADWIKSSLKVSEISPIGERVADILGQTWRGIYHLDTGALRRVDWGDDYVIRFILSWRHLSTYDSNELSCLVFLCHDAAIRLDITAVAPHRLELLFHQRQRVADSISRRHPSLEAHAATIRESLSLEFN